MTHRNGALSTWIEQVWRPTEIPGLHVAVARPAAPRTVWEQYLVLPGARHPRLLVPAGDLPAARRMIASHSRLATRRAQVMGAMARGSALSFIPLASWLHTLSVSSETEERPRLLVDEIGQALGYDGRLRAMFTVREPTAQTKPVFGLFSARGETVAYAKMGVSPATARFVQGEAAVLREVEGRLTTVLAPRLLAETTWFGDPVSILAPLPADATRYDESPDTMVDPLREVAHSGEYGECPLAQSSYAADFGKRLVAAADVSTADAELLHLWWKRVNRSNPVLTFGRGHGDWARWNLGRQAGRLVAWDWERSRRCVPVGFDYLHYFYAMAETRQGVFRAAAELAEIRGGLVRFGLATEVTQTVATLYLLDHFLTLLIVSGDTDAPGLPADVVEVASAWVARC